jgi:hypothetical protein
MSIACDEEEVMFQGERGDPKVIIGDRSARSLELNKEPGIVFGRLPARHQNVYGRFGQEIMQQNFVPMLLGTAIETGLDFRENKQWNPNLVASPQPLRQRDVSFKKIRQPVGVQGNPHFHLSASI